MLQTTTSGAALYGERLAVVLGFVTLALALATFVSCRSCLSFLGHLGLRSPIDTSWYRAFYKYHGYYWYLFLFVLVLHLGTALMHTAVPVAGDPDSQIHWIILSFGFASFASVGSVLSSCRSFVGLLDLFMEAGPLDSRRFRAFYRYHSYYWMILLGAIAGHVASAYLHTGIWPE